MNKNFRTFAVAFVLGIIIMVIASYLLTMLTIFIVSLLGFSADFASTSSTFSWDLTLASILLVPIVISSFITGIIVKKMTFDLSYKNYITGIVPLIPTVVLSFMWVKEIEFFTVYPIFILVFIGISCILAFVLGMYGGYIAQKYRKREVKE